MSTDFKARLNTAIDATINELSLDAPRVRRLYTPVWRSGAYRWISPMDSDGLLVKDRCVHEGDAEPPQPVSLRIGVVIQSEFATSNTKPNPFGKALIGGLPLGVWVDLDDEPRRVRLDKIFVLFIVPMATAAHKKKISNTARYNVLNAADAATEAHILEVKMGSSAEALAEQLRKKIRPWLFGAGRPVGT